jgi:SNF2-related domain
MSVAIRWKVSRAVRALSARHRPCMSGTPVGNNLSGIWSQLGFLMPALLDGRCAFAERFRTPIEKNGDATPRALLARRPKPFLLVVNSQTNIRGLRRDRRQGRVGGTYQQCLGGTTRTFRQRTAETSVTMTGRFRVTAAEAVRGDRCRRQHRQVNLSRTTIRCTSSNTATAGKLRTPGNKAGRLDRQVPGGRFLFGVGGG